ncbi:MAG: SH3 domain-containing protein [Candidatus Muiribacteriota bacterium]
MNLNINKILLSFFSFVFFLSTNTFCFEIQFKKNFSEITNTNTGVVNISKLNVRSGPSTQYPVLDTLSIGDSVSISRHLSDTWIEISLPPLQGYIFGEYIEFFKDSEESIIFNYDTQEIFTDYSVVDEEFFAEVNADNVNVREKPDTESKRLAIARRRTRVKILGKHEDWYLVSFLSRRTAYVYSRYISSERKAKILMDLTPVFKEPGKNQIVRYVPAGADVLIFEKTDSFFRVFVKESDVEGWVPSQSIVE